MEQYWKKKKGKENLQERQVKKTKSDPHSEEKSPFCQKLTLLESESPENDSHEGDQILVDECPPPHHIHHENMNTHIGEEAYIPVSLDILKRTLQERIKHE